MLVGYLGLMVGAARLCPPEKSMMGFVEAVLGLSAGLLAICSWRASRWGGGGAEGSAVTTRRFRQSAPAFPDPRPSVAEGPLEGYGGTCPM